MVELTFTNPGSLWLLVFVPLAVILHFVSIWYTKKRALRFANFEVLERATAQKQGVPMNLAVMLARALVVASLVLAVAGATLVYEGDASESDYVIAIDSSSSMLADDLSPNRLEAAKTAAQTLINTVAPKAEIGVVTFGGTSFIKLKPTDQLDDVRQAVREIEVSETGGTAIGEALVTSVNLLQGSKKGRAVVLLTDGQNNVGIDLEEAVDYAKANHVSVFPIGAGTTEGGRIQGVSLPNTLDEESLKFVADSTSGKYYRAESEQSLPKAFTEIALSSVRTITLNLQPFLVFIAALLLFIEWWLANIRYARIEWRT